jgi:hypothetical protein
MARDESLIDANEESTEGNLSLIVPSTEEIYAQFLPA